MIPADSLAGLGPATIIRGDARHLPLADGSVDLIVTSPPYFALRSYQDGGEHYAGQIGSEPTPHEFVNALIECTREMMRVLKPSGSIWINLGDKYASNPGQGFTGMDLGTTKARTEALERDYRRGRRPSSVPLKSLMGLPWRYALRCIDDLGLILRAEVIWSKCLSGGTVVYARTKGRVQAIKLHDLCRQYQPEDVELWTGERWSPVRAWEATARGAAQYEFELRSGERIGCTPEHRWPTRRGLLRSDQLAIGDVLDTCSLPDGEVNPAALDDEMVGWFVGLYIAEGSRSEQTIQIAGHVREIERYKRLADLAAAFHGTCRVHATGGHSATVNLTGVMLRAIIDTYVGGRTAKDKHLSPKCWQRSNTFLRAVLDGYLSGDGHWREDAHRWVLGFTDNDQLAADLRAIGGRVGMSVRLRRTTHTGYGKQWPGWGGSITEARRRRQPDSEIVAIRPSRARQFWDVAIGDEPHIFALASGVLTHNSNGLPESVTDRVRRSHEQWFHFVKQPRYFSAVDEIREVHARLWDAGRPNGSTGTPWTRASRGAADEDAERHAGNSAEPARHPLGKLPGSVREVPTAPLKVPDWLNIDHFAAFPAAWPAWIIRGWSPNGICTACGEGRRPVVHAVRTTGSGDKHRGPAGAGRHLAWGTPGDWGAGGRTERNLTGYACACPTTDAPTRPAVVLDPFGGTGTTAMAARALGRHGISVDLSADYCRLAQWRCTDLDELAAVRGLPREKRSVTHEQPHLFEAVGDA